MAFQIDFAAPLSVELRVLAEHELRRGLQALDFDPQARDASPQARDASPQARDSDVPGSTAQAVHDFRKYMKKFRALVRLVRTDQRALFDEANALSRDAARSLSEARDSYALDETLEFMRREHTSESDLQLIEQADRALGRTFGPCGAIDSSDAKRLATKALVLAGQLQVDSPITLVDGMKKTYARVRRCHRKALSRQDDALHELRKHVKYHRYHLGLMGPVFRQVLDAERKVAKKISDDLGVDHDLAIFQLRIGNTNLSKEQLTALGALIERRRGALQKSALLMTELLFAESPKDKHRRLRKYLEAIEV